MNHSITAKLISMEDMISSGCINIKDLISVIEDALLRFKKQEVLLPDKISQIFNEETQDRINVMPATIKTLGGAGVCGIKWVSVFPSNPQIYGCSNVTGVIILSELERGYPFAILDGTLITALRTACMGAIGAKYLAKKTSRIYGTIGAGEQAKMHFVAIKEIHPEIDTCYVASKTSASEDLFCREMGEKYPEVQFVACDSNYRKASENADIIVTAVSCQSPLLKADSIKPGAFYCHVGGWEDEYEVPLKADKIVCDRWDAVKHRTPTISRLYYQGRLKNEDIYADIVDIIDGTKPGRENDTEFNYFNSIGLGFIDVAVAYSFYEKVMRSGAGTDWTMKKTDIFSCL